MEVIFPKHLVDDVLIGQTAFMGMHGTEVEDGQFRSWPTYLPEERSLLMEELMPLNGKGEHPTWIVGRDIEATWQVIPSLNGPLGFKLIINNGEGQVALLITVPPDELTMRAVVATRLLFVGYAGEPIGMTAQGIPDQQMDKLCVLDFKEDPAIQMLGVALTLAGVPPLEELTLPMPGLDETGGVE